ncbi:MAG: BatA domain-containing protein [Maioricimonas sp. JB049]
MTSAMILAVTFTNPLLLWGLLAAAAPILIQLLLRRRDRVVAWAAQIYLRKAVQKQARRMRMESLLLMLLRTLLIALAAVALAGPQFGTTATTPTVPPPTHTILLIDTSLSMTVREAGQSRLGRARQIARDVVQEGTPGDTTEVLRITRALSPFVVRGPTLDVTETVDRIDQLAATDEAGAVAAALEQVLERTTQVPDSSTTRIVILSDFQKTNWLPASDEVRKRTQDALRELARRSDLHLISVSEADIGNVAITHLGTEAGATGLGTAIPITVTLRNFGNSQAEERTLVLTLGTEICEQRQVTIPADGSIDVTFRCTPRQAGELVITAEIEEDALAADDIRQLVLNVRDRLTVLLVNGRAAATPIARASGFVELALRTASTAAGSPEGPPIVTETIEHGQLAAADLSRFDVVYLCDVPMITPDELESLSRHLRQGGGVLVGMGPEVDLQGYARTLFDAERGLMPARLLRTADAAANGQGWFRFDPGDYQHPVLQPFRGNEDSGLLTTRIDTYVILQPAGTGEVQIPLRFETGDPAVLEPRLGAGRLFVITTSLDDAWGNWPLWPSYLPMILRMTRYSAAGGTQTPSLTVGDSIRVDADTFAAEPPVATLTSPAGTQTVLSLDEQSDRSLLISPPTARRGLYELSFAGDPNDVRRYAVNPPPAESDPAVATQQELTRELLSDARFEFGTGWAPRVDASLASEDTSDRTSAGLLLLVAGLMGVELLMARSFHWGLAGLLVVAACGAAALGGARGILAALICLITAAMLLTAPLRRRTGRERRGDALRRKALQRAVR